MNCPKCGRSEVRPSSRVQWIDRFRRKRALRCRTCRARFYGDGPRASRRLGRSNKPEVRRGNKRRWRWMRDALIFTALLILFLLFMRFLTRETSPSLESRCMPDWDFAASGSVGYPA
jgi:hypothetical protein